MADANDAGIGVGASGNGGTRVAESRLAMLAELRRNNAAQSQDNQDDNGADNNGIFDWQQRLATSTWARRKPAWAERQIVVNVPQLGTPSGVYLSTNPECYEYGFPRFPFLSPV